MRPRAPDGGPEAARTSAGRTSAGRTSANSGARAADPAAGAVADAAMRCLGMTELAELAPAGLARDVRRERFRPFLHAHGGAGCPAPHGLRPRARNDRPLTP